VSVDDDRSAVRQATTELLAAVNASDIPRVLALWADDGVMMPPHHPAVQGRAAIERYFAERFAVTRFEFSFGPSEIWLAGDIAIERVAYAVAARPVSGGEPVEDRGKGLHVYRREADGSWNLALDIWNSDLRGGP
jgi:uncharacterized protein (TIGR02246 family)